MAFALAVGDGCIPVVFTAFASSPAPPPLGLVTSITPTVVLWQDGREVTYTPSTDPGNPDLGLAKFVPTIASPLLNAKVRLSGALPLPNIDARAEGVVQSVAEVTNAFATFDVVVVRFLRSGLYLVLPTSGVQAIPGA